MRYRQIQVPGEKDQSTSRSVASKLEGLALSFVFPSAFPDPCGFSQRRISGFPRFTFLDR
jgi:hypothetical protein